MNDAQFCVYIMTDELRSRLYTGRTGNLKRRVTQHRSGNGGVFTRTHSLVRLVYFEVVKDEGEARQREKKIKRGSKKQRVKLIEGMNPGWEDLYSNI